MSAWRKFWGSDVAEDRTHEAEILSSCKTPEAIQHAKEVFREVDAEAKRLAQESFARRRALRDERQAFDVDNHKRYLEFVAKMNAVLPDFNLSRNLWDQGDVCYYRERGRWIVKSRARATVDDWDKYRKDRFARGRESNPNYGKRTDCMCMKCGHSFGKTWPKSTDRCQSCHRTYGYNVSAPGVGSLGGGGFKGTVPGIVYYIRVARDGFPVVFKIGITNGTIASRFRGEDLPYIEAIQTWQFEDGDKARQRETELLRLHRAHRYQGPPILHNGGNSELFVRDVLKLYKPIKRRG